jgi:5'-nucleotidase/UDP-sugar diphosphatase
MLRFRFVVCSLVILLLLVAGLLAQTVVIYHTSDIHGWYGSRRVTEPGGGVARLIGGYAALSALVKKEERPYVLLDSGDLYQGTPEGNFSKGMASIELMNQLGYRALALGNHEYDYGEENVRRLAGEARFPFLAANIRVTRTGLAPDYVRPYEIVEVGGRRLGILGLANSTTPTQTLRANVEGLEFQAEEPTAARLVGEIRKHGVDALILLVHGGISDSLSVKRVKVSADQSAGLPPDTLAIARAVPGIDVILGGHYHTGLEEGFRDPVSGTLIVESYHTLACASRVQLEFDRETGRLKSASSRLVDLDVSQTGEDPEVLRLLRPYEARVEQVMGQRIGESAEDLDQPALGAFINEVMRAAGAADVALQNPGGIRTEVRKGPVTMADVYRVMPFDNTVVTVELTGAQIIQLLRRTPMYASGIQVEWQADRDGNVTGVEVKMNGEPLDPTRTFRVATNNYLAFGASDILTGGANKKDTGLVIRDLMVKEIQKSSPLQRPAAASVTRLPRPARH